MNKMLVSIPDNIASRFRSAIPAKQRSKVIVTLIENELLKREQLLYECALAIEHDKNLSQEMDAWSEVEGDGLDNESW